MPVRWKGTRQVFKNLNREIAKMEKRSQIGLTKAGLFILNRSKKAVPVVTGNLRNSGFLTSPSGGDVMSTPSFKGKDAGQMTANHGGVVSESKSRVSVKRRPWVEVGYSAVYALSVHENKRAGRSGGSSPSGVAYKAGRTSSGRKSSRQTFSKVGGYKFLEFPLLAHKKRILKIIQENMRI